MGYVSYGSLLYEQEDLVQPEATQDWYNFGRYLSLSTKVALVVKNLPANAGDIRDMGLIPGSGRSPGGGHGSPLQFSCLENPMDRGAWWTTLHRVTQSRTRLKRLSSSSSTTARPGFDPWVEKIPWRRAWQPTLVFLPGESNGQRSLKSYSP